MSTGINAQTGPDNQPPTYTFTPTGARLPWVRWLRAWADEVARQSPPDCAAGAWVGAALHHAADEAVVWGVHTPETHTAQREATEQIDNAYLYELECRAHAAEQPGDCDDPCDPVTGSLLGPDEGAMRAWLACDPDDETCCN